MNPMIPRSAFLFLILAHLVVASDFPSYPLSLWYQQPSTSHQEGWNRFNWQTYINDALPIGCGTLGALITGEVPAELLRLNDLSLWSGTVGCPSGDEPEGYGGYQAFADLSVRIGSTNAVSGYSRSLDLSTARSSVDYTQDGISYHRSYAASHPDGVILARFSADRPGSCSGSIHLQDGEMATEALVPASNAVSSLQPPLRQALVTASNNLILLRGLMHNGMHYEAQVAVVPHSGSVVARGDAITFEKCDSLDLVIALGTDYSLNGTKGFRGEDPHGKISERIFAALAKGPEGILESQLKDYRGFFDRVKLDLGVSTPGQRVLPTDKRRLEAAKVTDPELEALLFQYGRYLMISSSRPGGLPGNLQGMWNDNNTPAWHCDYHANINIQMNYWPVEVANLPECHLPLFDLVESQIPGWREVILKEHDLLTPDGKFSTRGWAVKTGHNIQGGMTFLWDKTANAWYALHFWEHYAFGGDKEFLRSRAYPLMKEVCGFWEDHLKTLPDGRLVVPGGWSPEHGPHEDGVAYSQEIVWDLFNNTVQAADALGIDKEYRDKIASLRDKLVVPGIGSWGQLLEWMKELNQPEFNQGKDFQKDSEKQVQQLSTAKEGAAGAFIWRSFPAEIRAKLTANPKDAVTLVNALNSLVKGPSVANESSFGISENPPMMEFLKNQSAKDPTLVPWLNRTLISEGLKWIGGNVEDTPNDHHRHAAHLFAVYPGRQISVSLTPKLADAALVSLQARGNVGDVREWSYAWRCALYARLHQGNLAESQVRGFLGTTCVNLFGNHPPMVMDGNFGISAGIAEMLLQSHEGSITLLPALPSVWNEGSVTGLRARGGFEVDMRWKDGQLKEVVIFSKLGGKTDVFWNGKKTVVDLKPGESRHLTDADFMTPIM